MKNAAFFLVASQYVCTAAWLKLIELFPIAQRLFKNCCPCVSFHHCLNGLFFNSMNLVNFWHFIKLLEEVEISQVISNQHSKVIQLQYKGRRNAYTFEYQARYQMTHQRETLSPLLVWFLLLEEKEVDVWNYHGAFKLQAGHGKRGKAVCWVFIYLFSE